MVLCYVFGHEIRLCFALADASQSHVACAWQARWPQDVANMRKKLKSLSFSFRRDVRHFCYVFERKIRWCFAVADVSQRHVACAWQARWLQDVTKNA